MMPVPLVDCRSPESMCLFCVSVGLILTGLGRYQSAITSTVYGML
jgi:hypothetical protein